MTKVQSSGDVFYSGKLPHSEAEWLGLDGVDELYTEIDDARVQCAVFTPSQEKTSTGTIFIGGVPRDPERRLKLPLVNKLFGYAAAGIAIDETNPSYGISFNWPGQGKSDGNILATTINSRTTFLLRLAEDMQTRFSLDKINLVGMSMGSYCTILAASQLGETQGSIALLSPAAYPKDAHDIPYGQGFKDVVRTKWEYSSSPANSIMSELRNKGMISYFEHDDPPIPVGIQEMYRESAVSNPNFTNHTIMGVEHNFRRPNADPKSRNIIDNDAVRNFGNVLVDFLTD